MSKTKAAAATGAMLALLVVAAVAIYLLSQGTAGPAASPLLPAPSGEPVGRVLTPTDMAVFGAEVVASEGRPSVGNPPLGTGCLVRAQLVEGPSVGHLTVRCGEQIVYRSIDPAGADLGAPEREILEFVGPRAGSQRYALRYLDVGRRAGPRPQIDVDTRASRARIFRQGDAPWSLTLHVADLSFPRWGVALGRAAETAQVIGIVRLRATQTDRRGDPPAPLAQDDATCELYLRGDPGDSAQQGGCRVLLRCGTQLLYGAGPACHARCTFDEGLALSAVDDKPSADDGDPRLRFDRRASTLSLEDDGWAAQWRLDEPLACGIVGRGWHGFGVDSKATPWDLSVQASARQLVFDWKMGSRVQSQRLAAPGACAGLIELQTSDDGGPGTRYQLELGPSWRSFGGRWVSEQPAVVAAAATP